MLKLQSFHIYTSFQPFLRYGYTGNETETERHAAIVFINVINFWL